MCLLSNTTMAIIILNLSGCILIYSSCTYTWMSLLKELWIALFLTYNFLYAEIIFKESGLGRLNELPSYDGIFLAPDRAQSNEGADLWLWTGGILCRSGGRDAPRPAASFRLVSWRYVELCIYAIKPTALLCHCHSSLFFAFLLSNVLEDARILNHRLKNKNPLEILRY